MSRLAEQLSPITLGTVQLGLPYGRVQPSQPPDMGETRQILDLAWAGGVLCLDTARAYGRAEAAIGAWLAYRRGLDDRGVPLIVSKLPRLDPGQDGAAQFVHNQFEISCRALGVKRLDGYLVHSAADITRPGVVRGLRDLAEAGRIGAFGVSAYTAAEVERALEVPGVGIVQAPCSVFDRRLVRAGAIERCAARGVVFFARSAFLQGALLGKPGALPQHLSVLREPLLALATLAQEAGVSVAAVALASVLAESGVGSAVIGVTSASELNENLAAARLEVPEEVIAAARALSKGLPPEVLDPRSWPTL